MTHVTSAIMINAPAETLWQAISDFDQGGDYLPGVIDCTVEGEGIGALRTLSFADGSIMVERLEALDGAARQLSYALLTDTPFGNCLTTVTVRDLGPNQAELVWSATFEADGIPEGEAEALLEGALADHCIGLKQFVER